MTLNEYWDSDCVDVMTVLTSYQFETTPNPYLDTKIKRSDFYF